MLPQLILNYPSCSDIHFLLNKLSTMTSVRYKPATPCQKALPLAFLMALVFRFCLILLSVCSLTEHSTSSISSGINLTPASIALLISLEPAVILKRSLAIYATSFEGPKSFSLDTYMHLVFSDHLS